VGAERIDVAVVDAGPLIHLAEIGRLPIVNLFENLFLPDAVWHEAVRHKPTIDTELSMLGNIRRQAVHQESLSHFVMENNLESLHAGEKECLYLCKSLSVPIILTDDLAARETAKRLGIVAVGSVGIVIKAYRLNQISQDEAKSFITDLQDISTLFVTRAIIELAIEQLEINLQ